MSPKFGTSGLRGLVSDLTPGCVVEYVTAFVTSCPVGRGVMVGRDLRESSPRIAADVIEAVRNAGHLATDCGAVPTPALALAAMRAGQAAIMVTGSHIPADRNGLKFYLPTGEISKTDEAAISQALGKQITTSNPRGNLLSSTDVAALYVLRYAQAFGTSALGGMRLGIYMHSSVAADLMAGVVAALGAKPVPLGRSETFIPVDTEALAPETSAMLADWCETHRLDAILSTDGDADRPMLADHRGKVIPGDILGVLTARMLMADTVCTPVSSNGMIEGLPEIHKVVRTRIGSPYVIAAMEALLTGSPTARVVGFEANGGFLLGFEARGPAGALPALMTRDSLLPMLAPLVMAKAAGKDLAAAVAALPQRYTAADRLQEIDPGPVSALITGLREDPEQRAVFFAAEGPEQKLDVTDGVRVTFMSGDVVHFRPSGNAPELRCYTEAGSPERAQALVKDYLRRCQKFLSVLTTS